MAPQTGCPCDPVAREWPIPTQAREPEHKAVRPHVFGAPGGRSAWWGLVGPVDPGYAESRYRHKTPCGPEGFSVLPLPRKGVVMEVGPQVPGAHTPCQPSQQTPGP